MDATQIAITGGASLAGLVAAWFFTSVQTKLRAAERELLAARDAGTHTAEALAAAKEHIVIDAAALGPGEALRIGIEQIHAKRERAKLAAMILGLFGVLAAAVAIFALMRQGNGGPPEPNVKTSVVMKAPIVELRANVGDFVDGFKLVATDGTISQHLGGYGPSTQVSRCADGATATGLHGRKGRFIDHLGLKCSLLNEAESYNAMLVGGDGGEEALTRDCAPSTRLYGLHATIGYAELVDGTRRAVIEDVSVVCK